MNFPISEQGVARVSKRGISRTSEIVYCFFDEIQYAADWNNWLKVLYDTDPKIKIMATGSASPILSDKTSESGLDRWKLIHVPTLSFYEYCELLQIAVPQLPNDIKPTQLYLRDEREQQYILHKLSTLQVHFIRYLQVGGFPELALSKDDIYAQRILREDIVDKTLKRDIPSIYGIRNIADIERIFLYLCYNSSNIINLQTMGKEMDGISRTTIEKYISYLESASLITLGEYRKRVPGKTLRYLGLFSLVNFSYLAALIGSSYLSDLVFGA